MTAENSTVIVTAILALAGVLITALLKLLPPRNGKPLTSVSRGESKAGDVAVEFWLQHFERHHAAIFEVNTSINSLVDGAAASEKLINKLAITVDRLEKVAVAIENTVQDHATRITRLEIGER